MMMESDIVVRQEALKVDPDDYFSKQLPQLLEANCEYLLIYGQRSNGKTYALLEHCLKQYFEKGHEFAYIRRWGDDLRGANGKAVFSALVDNGAIKQLSNGKWTDVYYYSRQWYLAKWETNKKGEKVMKKDIKPFAYGFSLSEYERNKSTSYNGIQNIVFDEFLARRCYIGGKDGDEFVYFINTISTIIRHRDGVKIFLLGNTVSMFCPYFENLGTYRVREMKQGDFDIYEYGSSGLKVGVYWAPELSKNSKLNKSDKYFAFNNENSHLAMIREGKWEIENYPMIEWKIKPKDVVFTGYILYCEYIVQVKVCIHDGKNYAFCCWKTTPVKDEDHDVVFSTESDPRPNWRVGFGSDKLGKAVMRYFKDKKVFYQSNLVGEVVMNYLEACRR